MSMQVIEEKIRDSEPCRRFNKGRCTFGLSCKFDHRCSVKKCGKFGHGAHQCRLRESSNSNLISNAGGSNQQNVELKKDN